MSSSADSLRPVFDSSPRSGGVGFSHSTPAVHCHGRSHRHDTTPTCTIQWMVHSDHLHAMTAEQFGAGRVYSHPET
eukprot:235853-Amphidinium_carterae.1